MIHNLNPLFIFIQNSVYFEFKIHPAETQSGKQQINLMHNKMLQKNVILKVDFRFFSFFVWQVGTESETVKARKKLNV